ncbi:hypothetical protein ACX0HA_08835 [Flavobacterium hauense]
MRETITKLQNQIFAFTSAIVALPGLFNHAREAAEKSALMNSILRDLSELTTTTDTEIYFRKVKNEAAGLPGPNTDHIILKLQERLLQVRALVCNTEYSWRKIKSHCRAVDIGFEELYHFMIEMKRFPDYGEAICIRHFGLREIINALQEEKQMLN